METLFDFTLFAQEASGFSTINLFESVMEFALPLLKTLAFLIIIWGVVCAAIRLVSMESRNY